MKCEITIDKEREEAVLVYLHEYRPIADDIERLVSGEKSEIIGYVDKSAIRLDESEICCFIVSDNKIFALTDGGKYQIKERLYQIESRLGGDFVKINQSCVANVKKIKHFDASFSGALMITFVNGHKDYVSRRQLRAVKERMGIKI